jgi:hypothetical protein
MRLTAATLRQLIAVDAALNPLHHALDSALTALADLHALHGVREVAELLTAFKADLHNAHPIERYVADLKVEAAADLHVFPAPQSDAPDATDLSEDFADAD